MIINYDTEKYSFKKIISKNIKKLLAFFNIENL